MKCLLLEPQFPYITQSRIILRKSTMDNDSIILSNHTCYISVKPPARRRRLSRELDLGPSLPVNVKGPDISEHLSRTGMSERAGIMLAEHGDEVILTLNLDNHQS